MIPDSCNTALALLSNLNDTATNQQPASEAHRLSSACGERGSAAWCGREVQERRARYWDERLQPGAPLGQPAPPPSTPLAPAARRHPPHSLLRCSLQGTGCAVERRQLSWSSREAVWGLAAAAAPPRGKRSAAGGNVHNRRCRAGTHLGVHLHHTILPTPILPVSRSTFLCPQV